VPNAPQRPKSPNLDSVTTINADGSHYTLHPADVRGRFTWARRVFGILLLTVYVGLPWIQINDAPAVFLDIAKRQFHLFGITLAPQDLWVLFFGITGLGFGLFFITSLLGRLWCGWACPYTVFLEHIFRRIERLIDGDAPARRKLDAARWNLTKIWKRALKHGIYLFCAALLAHVFLSYFVSLKSLYGFMLENPTAHLKPFVVAAFLTGAFYFCFAWFREQFCIIMCPYGRLQSALSDDDTVVIGYDGVRGEPRGKASDPSNGSCIDCHRCVNVCPTGIDIREGLQMECIGCAACVDACDEIMLKVGRPKGLVRYDSMNALAGKKRRLLRPRIFAYATLGLLGLIALIVATGQKAKPYHVNSARFPGRPFDVTAEHVVNRYQLRLLNKRNQPATFTISLQNAPAGYSLSGSGQEFSIPAHGEITQPAILLIEKEHYTGPTEFTVEILGNPGEVTLLHKIRFIGPNPGSLK
jgi:cytochrome c oxidase accessory protein FixG